MKHRGIVIPVFLLLVLLWLFVAARPIRLELSVAPRWVADQTADSPPPAADGLGADSSGTLADDSRRSPRIPISLNGTLFYVDPTAGVAAAHRIPRFVAAASDAFIGYSGVAEDHLLQAADGEIIGRVAVPGAPFVVDDRFFVVEPFQDGVSALDASGARAWRARYPAMLLDLDHALGVTAVGLSDGTVRLLDESGNATDTVNAAELLEDGALHGVALSSRGAFLAAALSDSDAGHGAVYDLSASGRTPPVFALGPAPPGPVRVEFLSDDRLLTYGSRRSLTLVRLLRTPEITTIDMSDLAAFGAVFGNDNWEGLVYALDYRDEGPTLLLVTPEGRVAARLPLYVAAASVTSDSNAVIVAGATDNEGLLLAALEPRLR